MGRFTNLPARLREVASFDANQLAETENWLSAQGTIEDAALKIEALERDLAHHRADRPYIIGWNDGFDHATNESEDAD